MKTTWVCVVLAVSLGLKLALCWLLAGAQPPTVHAAGDGDGQSWATAYRTVEQALGRAGPGRRRATWPLSLACGFNRRVLPTPRWVGSPPVQAAGQCPP